MTDVDLWKKLMYWIRCKDNGVMDQGLHSFINIVSVPSSMRPGKDAYENMAKLLLSFSLVQPSFPLEDLENGKFPKFYTIFTNCSPLVIKRKPAGEDYGDESGEDD